MFKFPGGFKRKIGWQKWQGTTLQNVNANPPAINNWKHTKHRLPILFYISSTEVKYKLYSYILKRVKIKPRNVFTKTVNFSCYFKLFSISVKHLFRCQRNQSYCKIVLLSATQGVSIILWGPVYVRKSCSSRLNFSKLRLSEKNVDPFARGNTALAHALIVQNSARTFSNFLALIDWTRLGEPKCYMRKSWPS